jgi:bifunctional NMN adenylyltransferase/nudix hydrolase
MDRSIPKLGVFIGRFQPTTKAHIHTILTALDECEAVLVLIGSSSASVSTRNPFSFHERMAILRESIDTSKNPCLVIQGVEDSAYDFNDWITRVRKVVAEHADGRAVAIYGHEKDASSYYLKHFPDYEFRRMAKYTARNPRDGIDATAARKLYFSDPTFGAALSDVISMQTYKKMCEYAPADSNRYDFMRKEFAFIEKYKGQWGAAPYPPTFVTVDAVVLCMGHVLMIRRGRHPGLGQYALPGGFIGQNEVLRKAAIRELKEETNVDVSKEYLEYSLAEVRVFDEPNRDPRGRFITHAHLFDLDVAADYKFKCRLPEIKAGDDASHAEWVPLDKFYEMCSSCYADHYAIVKNMLGGR